MPAMVRCLAHDSQSMLLLESKCNDFRSTALSRLGHVLTTSLSLSKSTVAVNVTFPIASF